VLGSGIEGYSFSRDPDVAAVRGRHVYTDGYAGLFVGNVKVTGALTKGGGGFRVDHPVDPENNYLSHSFVESPDMTNVYSGKPCALIPSNTFLAKIRYRRGYGFRSADTSAVRGRGRRRSRRAGRTGRRDTNADRKFQRGGLRRVAAMDDSHACTMK
jgi:hypothetical protein